MTVAVAVKVFDGIILAADSATTLEDSGRAQVYNNANKIFHLHRHKPIAAVTWGLGNIGSASISTLAKDLRRRFMGRDPAFKPWKLSNAYTVEKVAQQLVEMIYPLYVTEFGAKPKAEWPYLGFLVAGYSGDERIAEAWQIEINDPTTKPVPICTIPKDQIAWAAYGQPDATQRLFNGFDSALPEMIKGLIPATAWTKVEPIFATHMLRKWPIQAPMPLADAIEVARFLCDVTVGYSHFLFGPDIVGGPVEVASMSRHEGFKWISRKHYYNQDLNPEESSHAY